MSLSLPSFCLCHQFFVSTEHFLDFFALHVSRDFDPSLLGWEGRRHLTHSLLELLLLGICPCVWVFRRSSCFLLLLLLRKVFLCFLCSLFFVLFNSFLFINFNLPLFLDIFLLLCLYFFCFCNCLFCVSCSDVISNHLPTIFRSSWELDNGFPE